MIKFLNIFIIMIFLTLLSGCSWFGIGDTATSQCDGDCNFKEAGVCADIITIYKHRGELVNRKVKENTFSEDEDPYYDKGNDSNFVRINEEDLED